MCRIAILVGGVRVRVNICRVGIGYGFRTHEPFVLALNNQRCFLVHSRAAIWHRVMPRSIGQVLITTLDSDDSFFLQLLR